MVIGEMKYLTRDASANHEGYSKSYGHSIKLSTHLRHVKEPTIITVANVDATVYLKCCEDAGSVNVL